MRSMLIYLEGAQLSGEPTERSLRLRAVRKFKLRIQHWAMPYDTFTESREPWTHLRTL